MVSFEMKLMFFTQKLEAKYKTIRDNFVKKMLHPQGDDLKYQPRVVVDEDEDDEMDMDN
jgi:hypothetical protein